MLEPGHTIGAYRVTGLLGQGGMGAVYVAEHTLLGRKAAIKVLLPAYSRDAGIVQRFFNEAKAVTQISDPGIVQVFDFGTQDDGSAYIVMELLDGETVASRMQRLGVMQALEVVRLIRLVCIALHAAHVKRIIHRDLKPENLFIVSDSGVPGGQRAKVLDFGIAKLSSEEGATNATRAGAMMGTPLYMSPEQCRGAGEVDLRSDIYSLGCVMFAMLSGRPPFEGNATGDLIVAHMQTPAPRVSSRTVHIPPALDEILARCMAKNADERFASMAELADALLAVEDQLSFGRNTPLPGAYARAATPAPIAPGATTKATAHGAMPATPTTLTAATSTAPSSPEPRRRWPVIAIAAGAAIAGTIGIVIATRGDRAAEPAGGSGSARDRVIEMKPITATAAAPVPPPPPPAIDAGIADATAVVAAPPDAAPEKKQVRQGTRTHAHPSSTSPIPTVDRGD